MMYIKQVRAGVEMAILDALAHSVGMPLWWLFGGQGNTIVTDITVRMLITSMCNLQEKSHDRRRMCCSENFEIRTYAKLYEINVFMYI